MYSIRVPKFKVLVWIVKESCIHTFHFTFYFIVHFHRPLLMTGYIFSLKIVDHSLKFQSLFLFFYFLIYIFTWNKSQVWLLFNYLLFSQSKNNFLSVPQQCGKSYKAKRSLNLHQTTHHSESGKMSGPMPPSLLSAQIPLTTSPLTVSTVCKCILCR